MNNALTILGSFGVGAIIVTILNGLFSKRKLSAEATKIIADAASGVVEILRAENARMSIDRTTQASEIAAIKEVIAIHAFWDRQVYDVVQAAGIDLPPPPPLHPDRPAV